MSTEQVLALISGVVSILLLIYRFSYGRGFRDGAEVSAEEVRLRDRIEELKKAPDHAERLKEIDNELRKKYEHDGLSAKEVVERLRRLGLPRE